MCVIETIDADQRDLQTSHDANRQTSKNKTKQTEERIDYGITISEMTHMEKMSEG